MKRAARLSAVTSLLLAVACGGGSGGGPTGPDPTPRHPVALTVFYDENGDGIAEATEGARVPDVAVEIAGQSGTSAKVTGETTVPNVPDGHHAIGVRSLPPYYRLTGAAPAVDVPQSNPAAVALTLPIGNNRANRYLGFGDSITEGLGSRDIDGYRGPLQDALQRHFGRATVEQDGLGGSKSDDGAERIYGVINRVRPAYTLILYGTNDWKRCEQKVPCYTIDAVRSMIGAAKAIDSLPILGTLPPVNPNENLPERNEWVTRMNVALRAMAQLENTPVADIHGGFTRAAGTGNELAALFVDTVHPNDRGYQIIADAFFKAITAPPAASSSSLRRLLFQPPPR